MRGVVVIFDLAGRTDVATLGLQPDVLLITIIGRRVVPSGLAGRREDGDQIEAHEHPNLAH